MRSLFLIVKGPPDTALAAAHARGIFPRVAECARFKSTYLYAPSDTPHETLNKWFCERTSGPFPDGTLLWWAPSITEP